jgi:hypothetical protein
MMALFTCVQLKGMKPIDFGNTEIECDTSLRYQILSPHSDRRRMQMMPCIQADSYAIHHSLTMINKRSAAICGAAKTLLDFLVLAGNPNPSRVRGAKKSKVLLRVNDREGSARNRMI